MIRVWQEHAGSSQLHPADDFCVCVGGSYICEMNKISDDPRVHPRIRRIMGRMPLAPAPTYTDREELMSIVTKPSSIAKAEAGDAVLDGLDSEDLAPLEGLDISTIEITSDPDGNTIKILMIRPEGAEGAEAVPGVVYLHGGGMMTMSCFLGMYQCWGRLIAHQGVAVAMVDFRNCLRPSSASEVEPFPAGLNDCVSSVRYVSAHAAELGIDPDRLIVAGESGGGNLTLATGMKLLADGDIDLISGLYALCPYIAGEWPQDRFPSSIENNGIFLDLGGNTGQLAYGIEHFEQQNPLAWPSFATASDVRWSTDDSDQRQRVRPAAGRRHRVLPHAERGRRARKVSPSHGHDPRKRDLFGQLPRGRHRNRSQHRPPRRHRLTSNAGVAGCFSG